MLSKMTSKRRKKFISVGLCTYLLQDLLDNNSAEELATAPAKRKEILHFTTIAMKRVFPQMNDKEQAAFFLIIDRIEKLALNEIGNNAKLLVCCYLHSYMYAVKEQGGSTAEATEYVSAFVAEFNSGVERAFEKSCKKVAKKILDSK